MAKKAKRELDKKNNEVYIILYAIFPIMDTLVIDSAGKKTFTLLRLCILSEEFFSATGSYYKILKKNN